MQGSLRKDAGLSRFWGTRIDGPDSTYSLFYRKMASSYDRRRATTLGTVKQASISGEAYTAFDDEVYPRVIKSIMEKAKKEISEEMLKISNGKWPSPNVEYSVLRHKPMTMTNEKFIDDIISAYIDWTSSKFKGT